MSFTVKQCNRVDVNVNLAAMINVKLPFKDEIDLPYNDAQ